MAKTSRLCMDPAVLRGASHVTVSQFCVVNPAFTEGAVRWTLFQRGDELERAGAIVRNGRRVFIVPDKFVGCVLRAKGVTA